MGAGRNPSRALAQLLIVCAVATTLAACGASATPSAGLDPANSTPADPAPTSAASTTSGSTTTSTSSTSSTSSTTRRPTSSTSSTSTTSVPPVEPLPDPTLRVTNAAFDALATENPAVSMTVIRDGVPVLARATGTTVGGTPATSDSPMVVASLSKLLTGLAVARLAEVGLVDVAGAVPWERLGITPDPAWNDVTVRELLDHTSGMPVARPMWFDGQGTCAATLPWLVAESPAAHRGEWTYSNGNYCALGLLVEAVTGRALPVAVDGLVLAPVGAGGAHVSTDGVRPDDVPYALGTERLSRLGGAGAFLVSTDDLARALAAVTPDDRTTVTWPAVMTDQYGWGHTGTVDGAKACAWVLERGRTVIVTTVAGNRPSTGGGVCDRTVTALAWDLGIGAGKPERSPV